MSDPITIQLVMGPMVGLAGMIFSGVLGNRSDAFAVKNWQRFRENLDQYRPGENHDLQRATYRAYLRATLQICAERGRAIGISPKRWILERTWRAINKDTLVVGVLTQAEAQWIESAMDGICERLDGVDRDEMPDQLDLAPFHGQIEILMQIETASEREARLREDLVGKTLENLREGYGPTTPEIERLFAQKWFNYLCANFQHQLAQDSYLANKFQNRFLASISVWNASSGEAIEITQEEISNQLNRYGSETTQRLDAIEAKLYGLSSTISKAQVDMLLPILSLAEKIDADIDALAHEIMDVLAGIQEINRDTNERVGNIQVTVDTTRALVEDQGRTLTEVRALMEERRPLQPSAPRAFIASLNLDKEIVGREEECGLLLHAMRSGSKKRVLCFTAPGGFGKSALLTKLLQRLTAEDSPTKRRILDPTIRAIWQTDCREGLTLGAAFAALGELAGKADEFQQIYQSREVPLSQKLRDVFAELSEGHDETVWIILDNFETLLDESSKIAGDELRELVTQVFAGNHRVRLLLASRKKPELSKHVEREFFLLLDEVGARLFEGLPIADCISYLRDNGAADTLSGAELEQIEVLRAFAERVHRIPMALVWAVGFLSDEGRNLKELLEDEELFEAFDQAQGEEREDYLERGLKRLHYEQLMGQEEGTLPILFLLALFKRYVPRAVFEHLPNYSRVLIALMRNKLVAERTSDDVRIRAVNDESQRLLYGLHPIICENRFFRDGYEGLPSTFEETIDRCALRATEAHILHHYAHALDLLECSLNLLEYLMVDQADEPHQGLRAVVLFLKGNALDSLGWLVEAIENFDEAIEIRKRLVKQGRGELANDLAATLVNKSNALANLGQLAEAIENYDEAIDIRKRLVKQGRGELINDLAMTLMNKSNALVNLERLNQT